MASDAPKNVYSSENFSSDKHVGYSDLVFEAQIKDGGTAALYVGIIAEHKKWPYKRGNLKMDRPETLLLIFHSFCHAGLVPTFPVLTQICIFRHDIAPYRMVRSDRNF